MNEKKDLQKAIVKEKFFFLGEVILKTNAAEETYLQSLAKLDAQSDTFLPEHISEQKENEAAKFTNAKQASHTESQKQLDKLQIALNELQNPLEIVDPALTNAISMIKDIGPDLGVENILKINSQFVANQPALKILQAAYKSAGVKFDGGLDKQIYNIDESLNNLKKKAEEAFLQDGSVFQFGVEIGKIAKFENVDFPLGDPFPSLKDKPAQFDAEKMVNSARKAAGLTN